MEIFHFIQLFKKLYFLVKISINFAVIFHKNLPKTPDFGSLFPPLHPLPWGGAPGVAMTNQKSIKNFINFRLNFVMYFGSNFVRRHLRLVVHYRATQLIKEHKKTNQMKMHATKIKLTVKKVITVSEILK